MFVGATVLFSSEGHPILRVRRDIVTSLSADTRAVLVVFSSGYGFRVDTSPEGDQQEHSPDIGTWDAGYFRGVVDKVTKPTPKGIQTLEVDYPDEGWVSDNGV